MGDGIALTDQVLARARHAEELVRESAGAGIGRTGEYVLLGRVMQRVVEPRDRARGIAKGRMRGHVVDALAVDPYLAAIAQAFEIFRPGEGTRPALDRVLGLAVHARSPDRA